MNARTRLYRILVLLAAALIAAAAPATAQYRLEVVHGFDSAGSGGKNPQASLLETSDGSLYGTTANGGAGDKGVVFQLPPDRSFVGHDLQGNTTGANPFAALVLGADGRLYGTTSNGGANTSGVAFAMTATGTFTTFDLPSHTTNCGGFGGGSFAPLTLAPDGNFYGTFPGSMVAISPCSVVQGKVFRLTPQGAVTLLTPPPFNAPGGSLLVGPGGVIYGAGDGLGVVQGQVPSGVYSVTTAGQFNTLLQFPSGAINGSGLIAGADGGLYGEISVGGASGNGLVYRTTPNGGFTVLHDFTNTADGTRPTGGLVLGRDGFFYGVAQHGGTFDAGTIFRVSPTGAFSVVYNFTGGADGGIPLAAPIVSADGSLYGTASTGGPLGGGVVYRIKSVASQPAITIDVPSQGAVVPPSFEIDGWTLDLGGFTGTGVDAVHIYAYPATGAAPIFLGVGTLGVARTDIGGIFGTQFTPSGYSLTTAPLAGGSYTLVAFAHSAVTNTFATYALRNVTVAAPVSIPAMALDVPAPNAVVTGQLSVGGWAVDLGPGTGTGVTAVHIWAFPIDGSAPIFLGAAPYGLSRPDVGAIFGARFTNSGYLLQVTPPPGTYSIAAVALSSVSGTFNNVRVAANVKIQ